MKRAHDHSKRSRHGILLSSAIASVMACSTDTINDISPPEVKVSEPAPVNDVGTRATLPSHAVQSNSLPAPNDLNATYMASVQRQLSYSDDAIALAPELFPAHDRTPGVATTLHGPLIGVQQAKLLASDGADFDEFGISVAFSGTTALVGAHDSMGTDAGAAYVFVNTGGMWVEEAKLVPSDGAPDDRFGISVALSGDTALVGAYLDDDNGSESGSAYVFTRSAGVWAQEAKLLPADGSASAGFGISVALSGDTALAGAYWGDVGGSASGSAYVFTRSAGVWTQEAKLSASDGAALDYFGRTAALDGDTAVLGAHLDDDNGTDSGSAYVFVRSGGVWTEQAKLLPAVGAADDRFGFPIAISGDTVLVGAAGNDDVSSDDSGAAYVFVRNGTAWTQEAKLVANDGAVNDYFGYSVAISGDTALVGASDDDTQLGADAGSAYLFTRSAGVWTQESQLLATDAQPSDVFGASVALAGTTALIGAWGDDDKAPSAGSAYIFNLALSNGSPCLADADCASTFCVDGLCCDTSCGGNAIDDCQACSLAAGAMIDGTCAPLSAGTECRAAADVCDVADACNGTDAACPPDVKVMAGTECRAAAGECDIAEACNGMDAACPPDVKDTTTVCRMSAAPCDGAEICNGIDDSCPPDAVAPPSTVCRMAVGVCDAEEICDGLTDICPADAKKMGTICRASAGVCDASDTCDGTSDECPADQSAPEGTYCPGGACHGGTCAPAKPTPKGCGCTIPGANASDASWLLPILLSLTFIGRRRLSWTHRALVT